MTRLELLAPAKDLQSGIAAIDHGADAVYIGAHHWGARYAAGNSVDDIASLCHYAHQFGVRVYVTVNTLIRDDEMDGVCHLLQQLAEASVDAILVQDMKLIAPLSQLPMAIHASTQADNRTAEKVEWLSHHGFSRAVLARELSAEEIASIHQRIPQMELEVFVHGALCVSYSGLCYASEHCFNRSANRGECAQFCRMKFDLLDADGQELGHQRHFLSLKDLNLSNHLEKLINAGATSFKIEGRLKDISYVKNVTAAYSQLLNRYISTHPDEYVRASRGRCDYAFTPDLERTFNRGFTTYFVDGRQPRMASLDTPKAIGQFVGLVKEIREHSFTVSGTASFTNGDGLCFFDKNRQLAGFRVNRAEGNRLFPQTMPAGLQLGQRLYRSNDQAMDRMLSKSSAQRSIPVTMRLETISDGESVLGVQLTISDGIHKVSEHRLMEFQVARTPQQDLIRRELSKLGNTPFDCDRVDIPDDFAYFIPNSILSTLRRQVCDSLLAETSKRVEDSVSSPADSLTLVDTMHHRPSPLMQCRYCLRYELGYCMKKGGKKPAWREPLSLRLGDGRMFSLEFNCHLCQMNVYAE